MSDQDDDQNGSGWGLVFMGIAPLYDGIAGLTGHRRLSARIFRGLGFEDSAGVNEYQWMADWGALGLGILLVASGVYVMWKRSRRRPKG